MDGLSPTMNRECRCGQESSRYFRGFDVFTGATILIARCEDHKMDFFSVGVHFEEITYEEAVCVEIHNT
jgi:hypothetical protein